ncbi:MAG: hypothetical protein QNJ89_06110 [Acidimicrobiia bacterium]|nr:hypothetical protein [Acidimicrobiia bacterium]
MTISLPPIGSVAESFDAAAGRLPVFDRWFRIAEAVFHIRIAGEPLVEPLTRALAHLATEPVEQPDIVINCWDRATSGLAPPFPPIDRAMRDGVATERGDEGLIAWGSPTLIADSDEGWAVWRPAFGTFNAVTPGANEAWHWVEAAGGIRYWDVSAPFKAILHRWARARGKQLLHAGAVGTDDGAALIVGKGGSGKSTTSLVCLDAGMKYLGDDYVMVSLDPEPRVHSTSCAAKLEVPQIRRHPHLMPTIWNGDRLGEEREEKAVAFVDHTPTALASSLPLKMVIVPRITGATDTKVSQLSGGGAFLALAPSTIIQMPGARNPELAAMGELVRKVSVAGLELGSDLSTIAPAIKELLRQCQ